MDLSASLNIANTVSFGEQFLPTFVEIKYYPLSIFPLWLSPGWASLSHKYITSIGVHFLGSKGTAVKGNQPFSCMPQPPASYGSSPVKYVLPKASATVLSSSTPPPPPGRTSTWERCRPLGLPHSASFHLFPLSSLVLILSPTPCIWLDGWGRTVVGLFEFLPKPEIKGMFSIPPDFYPRPQSSNTNLCSFCLYTNIDFDQPSWSPQLPPPSSPWFLTGPWK